MHREIAGKAYCASIHVGGLGWHSPRQLLQYAINDSYEVSFGALPDLVSNGSPVRAVRHV